MKRPFCNKEYIKYAYGRYKECIIYNLNRTSDPLYEVIKYYPIRIIISNIAQLNFKLLSCRFACMEEGNNSIVESLYLYKFNIEILCALSNYLFILQTTTKQIPNSLFSYANCVYHYRNA